MSSKPDSPEEPDQITTQGRQPPSEYKMLTEKGEELLARARVLADRFARVFISSKDQSGPEQK